MAGNDPIDNASPESATLREDIQIGSGFRPVRDPIQKFFTAVVLGDMKALQNEYADMGDNINIKESETKSTALHYGAAYRSRPVIKWLIRFKELDYLVRDYKGRLPSVLAYEVANDPALGRFLAKKENEQARARGIDIRTLFAPSPN
ncbi:MAG: hypothetical protein AB1781_07480 [Pseudomonadota bacterium]